MDRLKAWFYHLDTDALCHNYNGQCFGNPPVCIPGILCTPMIAPYVSQTGNNGAENPVALSDGMHYRAVPWIGWSLKMDGTLYYKDGPTTLWDTSQMNAGGNYGPPRPRISAALWREGLEVSASGGGGRTYRLR